MCKKNKKEQEQESKLSFSKISVLLMYLMVIGFFVFVAITEQYPPTEFIIAWMGFWSIQAVVTAVLEINNRGHKDRTSFIDAIAPYLNEENVSMCVEKYLGFDPKYKKKCKREVNNE